MRRRFRPVDELVADPSYLLMLGRIVGAAQLAGVVLSMRDDPELKAIGDKLAALSDWFFEAEPP